MDTVLVADVGSLSRQDGQVDEPDGWAPDLFIAISQIDIENREE